MQNPISDQKLAANRENAKRSTGPKTSKGKAISSLNALTHGVFAKKTVAIGPPLLEDPKEFLVILEGLRAHYEPVGVLEDVKVEEIASINWKKIRLERYETAGISERLFATIAAVRRSTTEERFGCIQKGIRLGSSGDPKQRPTITAAELREQLDLVERLKVDDATIDEEPNFLAFVWFEKCGEGGEATPPEHSEPVEQLKTLLAGLPAPELEDLRKRFRSQMEEVLEAMWDLRAKTVPHEAAIERSLIPDAAEMDKIMRTRHISPGSRKKRSPCSSGCKPQDAKGRVEAGRAPGTPEELFLRNEPTMTSRRREHFSAKRSHRSLAGGRSGTRAPPSVGGGGRQPQEVWNFSALANRPTFARPERKGLRLPT